MNKFLNIMGFVMKLVPNEAREEIEQSIGEYLLNAVEEFVERTDNKIDDRLVLPMVEALRIAYDNKEQEKES
jgi:hypothetical protein